MILDNGYSKIPYNFNGGINLDLVENDSQNLTENFICSICLGLVLNPILCRENECIFCKDCIESWQVKNKECPNCKKNFSKNENMSRLLKNVIFKIKIKCVYLSSGCQKILTYENYIDHVGNCDFSKFKCDSCNFESDKSQMLKHIEECEFRKIICEICKASFSTGEIKSHRQNCKKECPVCKIKIEISEIGTHNKGICYDTLVNAYINSSKISNYPNFQQNQNFVPNNLSNSIVSSSVNRPMFLPNSISQSFVYQNNNNQITPMNQINLMNPQMNSQNSMIFINGECHKIVDFTTVFLIKNNFRFNRFSCCLCRKQTICRFQCQKCKLYICYKCYLIKTKRHCYQQFHHNMIAEQSNSLFCDICCEEKVSTYYRDFECGINICGNCNQQKFM